MTAPSDLLQGSDRYRTIRQIGSGGMATVYLAEDLRHNRRVAIKVMKTALSVAIGPDRFLREIEVAARLNHPHIVPLFDSGASGEALFYVMPYIPGESLRTRLARDGQLPLDEAIRFAKEIASALGHAHHHGLIHRDIKPENVLIADGIALVADFGIAFSTGTAGSDQTQVAMTLPGGVVGTPIYMSPEQACGERVGPESDIYSLGCVLFEMLTGRPPFEGTSTESVVRMHLTELPPAIDVLRPSIPPAVARVVARALAKRPQDRYGSAAQFAEALAAAAVGSTTPVPASGAEALPPNNLPAQRTHFIGRDHELAECARILGDTRVLTLTGIGGCGKTRLALQLGERMLRAFPDGVWFVDLAPVNEGTRVIDAVAAALRVRELAGQDLSSTLADHVAGRKMLLILDNCEHLLTHVSAVADLLLAAGAGLRLLVTSREGLGIDGERLLPLRSLATPAAGAAHADVVRQCESVKLFVDRARRVVSDFDVTPANAAAVAEICRRLDGIPLAIELAAARVKVLSIQQIRERLDDRFRLLTGGSRTAMARHQTLQAAIEWSHDQLTPAEQRLFRRLAVFSGGWTFDSLRHIAGEATDEFALLDDVSKLVDKSLVIVDRRDDAAPRYSLLETVRQFALDRLRAAGEVDDARQRHADEFLSISEDAYAGRLIEEDRWSAILEREHDNLRLALDRLRDTDAERHLQMAGALGWFWQARSYLVEGREQLSAALSSTPADPPRRARARALSGVAGLLAWQGRSQDAANAWREALEVWRRVGDEREVSMALEGAGWADFVAGEDERAYETFQEYMRLQRETGDVHRIHRAMVAVGQLAVALDKVDQARACAAEILAYCKVHPNTRSEHLAFHYMADCALIEQRFADSLQLYRESLRLALILDDHVEIGFETQGIAMSLAGLGDARAALLLVSGIAADWARVGAGVTVRFWGALLDRHIGSARTRLGDEADAVCDEGRALPFADVIRLAMNHDAGARR